MGEVIRSWYIGGWRKENSCDTCPYMCPYVCHSPYSTKCVLICVLICVDGKKTHVVLHACVYWGILPTLLAAYCKKYTHDCIDVYVYYTYLHYWHYTARLIRMSILMCMYTIYTIYILNTWVYWCVYALYIDVCIYYIRNIHMTVLMCMYTICTCVYWCVYWKTNVCVSKQCMCFTTMYVFLDASTYWNQFNVWNNKWCVSTCVWALGCTEYLYMQHICITHSEFVGGQIPFEFAGRLFPPISAFEAFEDSWLDAAVLALCVGWWWSVADVLPVKRTHSIVREHIL